MLILPVFFYELTKRNFLLYPGDLGMTVDEFIFENKHILTRMKADILKKYGLELNTKEVKQAIREFLDYKGIRDPKPHMGVDWSDREIRLERWKMRG